MTVENFDPKKPISPENVKYVTASEWQELQQQKARDPHENFLPYKEVKEERACVPPPGPDFDPVFGHGNLSDLLGVEILPLQLRRYHDPYICGP